MQQQTESRRLSAAEALALFSEISCLVPQVSSKELPEFLFRILEGVRSIAGFSKGAVSLFDHAGSKVYALQVAEPDGPSQRFCEDISQASGIPPLSRSWFDRLRHFSHVSGYCLQVGDHPPLARRIASPRYATSAEKWYRRTTVGASRSKPLPERVRRSRSDFQGQTGGRRGAP
jgi:hypothetical protein